MIHECCLEISGQFSVIHARLRWKLSRVARKQLALHKAIHVPVIKTILSYCFYTSYFLPILFGFFSFYTIVMVRFDCITFM